MARSIFTKALDIILAFFMLFTFSPYFLCAIMLYCGRRMLPSLAQQLPTHRIDIGRRPLKTQRPSCHLLSLPPELRQYIYELALGGRVICLTRVGLPYHSASLRRHVYKLNSACYVPLLDAESGPNKLDVPADGISTGLLFSCRQVYLEALPILRQRNTFYLQVYSLADVLASLGYYCLPDIRSVYLHHIFDDRASFHGRFWDVTLPLLQRMRLDSLVFEFEKYSSHLDSGSEPELASVLYTEWGRGVLGIRNLRRLAIFLTPNPPVYMKNINQQFRKLMVGPGADERYAVFRQEYPESERKGFESSYPLTNGFGRWVQDFVQNSNLALSM
jgi:hypothetical protein